MHPPDDPYVILHLFGFLTIRWYAVCILGGALLAAWFGARRAANRGYNPEHAWNLLAFGLVIAIVCARAWYVFFEWPNFRENHPAVYYQPRYWRDRDSWRDRGCGDRCMDLYAPE